MTNILIADDNISYARCLMTYINKISKEARICSITVNGKETLKALENTKDIDIVLLDLKMPFYNGTQIIEKLSLEQKNKFRQSIIIVSGDNSLIQNQMLRDDTVYKILPKTLSMEEISSNISSLIKEKEENRILKNTKKENYE